MKETCIKYFKGESSAQENAAIMDFISSSQENKALFDSWEKEWMSAQKSNPGWTFSMSEVRTKIARRRARRIATRCTLAAACAALAIIASVNIAASLQKPQTHTVCTACREKTEVVLPDGSTVKLNSSTTLTYDSDFGKRNRDVTLSGQAIFDVVKNEKLPFEVNMHGGKITVRGTLFDVAAYEGESEITAALLRGKIDFTSGDATVSLKPNEVLQYGVTNGKISKYETDVNKILNWQKGKLEYESVSLDRLCKRLASIYGIEISYSGRNERQFSLILNDSESIYNLLDAISFVLPIKYTTTDTGSIVLSDKK